MSGVLAAELALPLQWLAIVVIAFGVGFVAGHEGGYREGRRAERERINAWRRNRERTP